MSACSDACKGDQAVYRITLALTLFFAAHAFLVTLVPYAFAKEIHTACFGVKVLMFIGMVIGMFYMENESLNQFAEACRVISLIFLVFQSIVIIDYAYTLHFWMIDKEQTSWDIANLSLSGLMIASVITVVGLMFHWFADGSSCGLEKFVLSMTIIVPFFYTVAACTDYIPHGALFPSACVTGYATYIAYTAMLSSTNGECNTLIDRSGGASQWELAIGIIIAVASITFTTWNIGSQSSKLFGARGEDEKNDQIKMGDNYQDQDADEKKDNDEEEEEEENISEEEQAAKKYDWIVFHILMTVASMYACMLLTSWSTNVNSEAMNHFT
uniref:Uncharacterized protein n=3 Tax=Lotharella globosa TaxID=91324 RepID=A0A6V3PNW9_9EUKA